MGGGRLSGSADVPPNYLVLGLVRSNQCMLTKEAARMARGWIRAISLYMRSWIDRVDVPPAPDNGWGQIVLDLSPSWCGWFWLGGLQGGATPEKHGFAESLLPIAAIAAGKSHKS